MKTRHRESWWTRARVIEGLQRFYRKFGQAPTASDKYQKLQQFTGASNTGVGNPYPSTYGVLKYFSSFREAWRACGVKVNRGDESWTPDEEWFLAEAAGILSRKEIAAYLDRTPNAVHRRLYDLGIHSYRQQGWTLHRVERCANFPSHILRKYIERGELPIFRGSKCIYCDPADLLIVTEIDWSKPPKELADAVRRSLMERMVKILSGQDWRVGRLFKAEPIRTTTKRWHNPRTEQPTAKPVEIEQGDFVRIAKNIKQRPQAKGRVGIVQMVYFSANRQTAGTNNPTAQACWKARVEFKRVGDKPRLKYTLPLNMLRKAKPEAVK